MTLRHRTVRPMESIKTGERLNVLICGACRGPAARRWLRFNLSRHGSMTGKQFPFLCLRPCFGQGDIILTRSCPGNRIVFRLVGRLAESLHKHHFLVRVTLTRFGTSRIYFLSSLPAWLLDMLEPCPTCQPLFPFWHYC